MFRKSILTFSMFALIGLLLSGCDEGLRITGREIGTLPDKTTYVQYIDREIDFTGGTVLYHLQQGTTSETEMTSAVIMEAVDFNTPGKYTVTLDPFDDNPPTFTVTVISIDEADGLSEETITQAKRLASIDTSQDQKMIIQVINDYFDQHYQELLADDIAFVQQNKEDFPTYDELIARYENTTFVPSPVYRNFQIQNGTAVVRMTEYTNWYDGDTPYRLSYSRRTISLVKDDKGEWVITDYGDSSCPDMAVD